METGRYEKSRRPWLGRRHSALAASASTHGLQRIEEPVDGDCIASLEPAAKRARIMRSRSARVVASAATMETPPISKPPAAPEPTRYEEMMERFQVRQLQRTPSALTDASGGRKFSTDAGLIAGNGIQIDRGEATSFRAFGHTVVSSRANSTHSSHRNAVMAKYQVGSSSFGHPAVSRIDNGSPEFDNTSASMKYSCADRVINWLKCAASDITTPISPFSTLCQIRYMLLLAVAAIYLLYFPVELAFPASGVSTSVNIVVSLIFGADALLELNTSVISASGNLVTSRRRILLHYMKHRFLIDVVSTLPIDLMLDRHVDSTNGGQISPSMWTYVTFVFRFERLVIVVRLVRLVWQLRINESANTIWAWVLYSRYSHLLRIAWIILLVLVIAHYIACIWAVLAVDTVSALGSWTESYAYSFYVALQLLQGQGIPTDSYAQDMFASFSILLGSLVIATVFGHVAILVANFSATITNYQRKMETVFAVMTKMRLPPLLRERIHVYYDHLWNEYECLDGEIAQFTKELSHSLELEVVLFKYMEVVMNVPFFKDCTPDFQKQLLLSLQIRVYLPDDFIMREGEVGDELFIVNRGYCELVGAPKTFERVTGQKIDTAGNDRQRRFGRRRSSSVKPTGHSRNMRSTFELDEEQLERVRSFSALQNNADPSQQLAIITRGQAFGDLALLMNYQYTANVRAITHVEMCVLSRKSFQTVLARYPDDRRFVVLEMLTSYMNTCEKHGLPCPLLDSIRSACAPSVAESLSVADAAERVFRTIDADLQDTSIKYGVNAMTRERLLWLRDRKRQEAQQHSVVASSTQPNLPSVDGATGPFASPFIACEHGQHSQQQHQLHTASSVVPETERQRITTRLRVIEERERTIQVALKNLDASLAEIYEKHAAELQQARAEPCVSCKNSIRQQNVSISTQTEQNGASPPKLTRKPSLRAIKKPLWVRVKSQPQLNIKTEAQRLNQSQGKTSLEHNTHVGTVSTSQIKESVPRLHRQRSQSVMFSSSNEPELTDESARRAIKVPSTSVSTPLLQRMGTLVRLGSSLPATTIKSPTRYADELFNLKKTNAKGSDTTPPQTQNAEERFKGEQGSDINSSQAVINASETVKGISANATTAGDTAPTRRTQFQRRQSRSMTSLANVDVSRKPGFLTAMGNIVSLLDGTKGTSKHDTSPTRYADELFQQTAIRHQRRQSVGAVEVPSDPNLEKS